MDTVQPGSPVGVPPESVYLDILTSYWKFLAIHAVADMGLADYLKDGPLGVEELAAKTKADAHSIFRIMRAMANAGFFAETKPGTFALTAVGQLLRSDLPNSFRPMILAEMGMERVPAWHNLPYSFRTGKVAWDDAYQGKDVWQFYRENPAKGENFARYMSGVSFATNQAIIEAFDFSAFATIIDIGGGQGQFLASVLQKFPTCNGVLFDQPQVVATVTAQPRMRCVGGDFFESVPAGGDLYTLKWIIHDWEVPKAVAILQNIRKAMKAGAKVMLIEALVSDGPEPDFAKWMDINMMVITGGEERSAAAYKELLSQAGFVLEQTIQTQSFPALLVARPA